MSAFLRMAVVSIGFIALSAHAYLPPATFIVHRMEQDRSKLKTLELSGKITDPRAAVSFHETLRLDFVNGKAVAWFTNDKGESLGVYSTHLRALHLLGLAWIEAGLDPNPTRFRTAMEELGVFPTDATSVKMNRIGTRPTWSWGENQKIQIAKDQFVVSAYSSAQKEMLVTDFTEASSELRLPKSIRLSTQGQPAFLYELKGFKVNAPAKGGIEARAFSAGVIREWVELVR